MSAETIHWYRSKVDWWIAVLLCIGPVVAATACIALVMEGGPHALWPGLAGLLLLLGIYLGLVFPMRYGMDNTHLHVRHGLCWQRVPLADIIEVHPTRNPLSSPALSLDRLHVRFGAGAFQAVMISPMNRDEFLNNLASRTGLNRGSDGVYRA